MGASVSHLAPRWMAPWPSPGGQQASCVRPLENGHDRGRQEELLLAGDSGDGGQVLPDPGGHREGGRGSRLFLVATRSPEACRRREGAVASARRPSRPCRQAPRQQRRLPSLPVCPLTPCPRPEPWAPARPVSSSTSPLSLLPPPAPRPSAWALVHPPELLSGSFQPQLGHDGFCSESPELNSMYALPASRAPYVYPPGRAPAELLMYTSSLMAPSALSLSL